MKMKKSKIIVPALGLLLLSTAASVTGTVAWFTATKEVTVTAGEFEVSSTTGDLKVTATAKVGTTVASGTANINPATGAKLADASVNHNTNKAYKPVNNAQGVAEHSKLVNAADVANADYLRQALTSPSVVNKYSVFIWEYTFEYTPEAGVTVGLFFDFDNSSVTDETDTNASDSYLGFRTLFITSAKSTVWSANRAKAGCSYVNGGTASTITTGSYGTADLISSDQKGTVPAEGTQNAATAAANPAYIGSFGAADSATGVAQLVVRCVVWFEGTDADVVNAYDGSGNKEYDTVSSSMRFEARNLAAE